MSTTQTDGASSPPQIAKESFHSLTTEEREFYNSLLYENRKTKERILIKKEFYGAVMHGSHRPETSPAFFYIFVSLMFKQHLNTHGNSWILKKLVIMITPDVLRHFVRKEEAVERHTPIPTSFFDYAVRFFNEERRQLEMAALNFSRAQDTKSEDSYYKALCLSNCIHQLGLHPAASEADVQDFINNRRKEIRRYTLFFTGIESYYKRLVEKEVTRPASPERVAQI